jgi:hypothetical protein
MLNAGSETWNASERAQRQHLIKILQEMIDDLSADSQESEAPAPSPAAARFQPPAETKATQRTASFGRRAARQGAASRRRLVASRGRRRR